MVAVHDDERGTRWYAFASCRWDHLDQAPVVDNTEQHGTTPADAPLVGYVVTFASPRTLHDERWAIEAYARHQLTGRIRQRLMARLGLPQVRLGLASNHVGFAHTATGAEVAVFTAVPVPDAAEFARYQAEAQPAPQEQWHEPIPCGDQHHEHAEHIWTHPAHGPVQCLGMRLSAEAQDG